MNRLRFTFDGNRCTGCDACRVACFVENGFHEPGVKDWRKVHTYNKDSRPNEPRFHLSLACQHCADPACANACPADAFRIDGKSGAVLLDRDRCIGCRYCTWACPYGAPEFDRRAGTVSKCTFCHERQQRSLAPACATLCPTGALGVEEREGEMTDRAFRTGSFPGVDRHGPALRILPLRAGRFGRDGDGRRPWRPADRPGRAITIGEEWPLALFTYLATLVVALVVGSLFRPAPVPPVLVLAAGLLAMAVSTMHLGRPLHAWRAALGWRRSPLSREIVFYGLFLAALAASNFPPPGNGGAAFALRIVSSLAGLAFLFSVDQVYARVRPKGDRSGGGKGALATSVFLAALFAGFLPLAALIGMARIALYLAGKMRAARCGHATRPLVAFVRVTLGIALPALFFLAAPGRWTLAAVLSILVGELVDRLEYYLELRVADPEQIMVNFAANQTGSHEIDQRS